MKKLILLFTLALFGSCASNDLRRFGATKYFQRKIIHVKNNIQTDTTYGRVQYVQSRENHCFDEVDDREVFTVMDDDLKSAIQHFYFRQQSHNIKVVTQNGYKMLQIESDESAKVDLEVAYCTFVTPLPLFNSIEGRFASFRLVKD